MVSAVLVGCGAGAGGTADVRGGNGEAPPGFPVTITNCGVSTTYQGPPQRVVAFGSTIEVMLALGLGDRMVGTAYSGSE